RTFVTPSPTLPPGTAQIQCSAKLLKQDLVISYMPTAARVPSRVERFTHLQNDDERPCRARLFSHHPPGCGPTPKLQCSRLPDYHTKATHFESWSDRRDDF